MSIPERDTEAMEIKTIKSNLISTVKYLSEDIGQRSYADVVKLNAVADYIEDKMRAYGCAVKRQPFTYRNSTYYNIIAEIRGTGVSDKGMLVIGAHYDTVVGTPGADDNATGVAGLLELARLFSLKPPNMTVRLVAFSLEEPPVFMTRNMGSYIYAERLKEERTKMYGMISLEMLGYYCEQKGCQFFPLPVFKWFYPDTGNFIAFVGNISSIKFTRELRDSFRAVSSMPAESLSSVSIIPGIDFSDHRNFWKFGYPAVMVTDTAFYRNPNYHGPGDTHDTIDYDKLAEVVIGLYRAIWRL